MNIETLEEKTDANIDMLFRLISQQEKRISDLQKRLDNLCNDNKVLSAVADKLIENGVLK